ncbi:hypothetical protein O3P69_008955 [Scylla paramamosain]|uniref:Uncharacterized protein n=1 Tax=Scylla paramamosain TaxID=85552 RepID=A0AAW0TRE4_SCYPA
MAWPAETLDHWPSDGRGTGYPKVFIEYCKSDVKGTVKGSERVSVVWTSVEGGVPLHRSTERSLVYINLKDETFLSRGVELLSWMQK